VTETVVLTTGVHVAFGGTIAVNEPPNSNTGIVRPSGPTSVTGNEAFTRFPSTVVRFPCKVVASARSESAGSTVPFGSRVTLARVTYETLWADARA
jgi:hypothetical protein